MCNIITQSEIIMRFKNNSMYVYTCMGVSNKKLQFAHSILKLDKVTLTIQ